MAAYLQEPVRPFHNFDVFHDCAMGMDFQSGEAFDEWLSRAADCPNGWKNDFLEQFDEEEQTTVIAVSCFVKARIDFGNTVSIPPTRCFV